MTPFWEPLGAFRAPFSIELHPWGENGEFSKMSVSLKRELHFRGSGPPKSIQKAPQEASNLVRCFSHWKEPLNEALGCPTTAPRTPPKASWRVCFSKYVCIPPTRWPPDAPACAPPWAGSSSLPSRPGPQGSIYIGYIYIYISIYIYIYGSVSFKSKIK